MIAEWPKNRDELVRIRLGRFEKCFTVEIRVWSRSTNGSFVPTRNGVTLIVSHLPRLVAHLSSALKRAELFDLVEVAPNDRIVAQTKPRDGERRR